MIVSFILVVTTLILCFGYLVGKFNEIYWKKRGVAFHTKNKVLGVFWDFITQDRSLFLSFADLYSDYPEDPAVAFGSFFTPALYVKDLTNIHHVMREGFHSFSDRGLAFHDNDKLAHNVLLMHGSKWKLLRQAIMPLFTTTRLRKMFDIVDRSAQDFVVYLKTNPNNLKVDTHITFNKYSCAAIAAALFGIGTKPSFESQFLVNVRQALRPTFWKNVRFSISMWSSWIFRAMGMSLFSVGEMFFIDSTKQILTKRKNEEIKKNDFADICINLQKNGKLKDFKSGFELEPTDEVLAAQMYLLFLAGVEPCAAVMFVAMTELGRNPDILQRVHKEIDEIFEKYNGSLTYDAVNEMDYLNNVMNEALRIYPPIGFLTRECVQDAVLPVGNIKIDKGSKIFTPIYEVHHDPKYFPNPDVFEPDRFSRENIHHINRVFFAFGKGNRVCIGLRYAMLLMKAGIAHVLRHYSVKTIVKNGGMQYSKEQVQVRIKNVDFELIPRC